MIDLYKGNEPF